jgi:hypothetical protein
MSPEEARGEVVLRRLRSEVEADLPQQRYSLGGQMRRLLRLNAEISRAEMRHRVERPPQALALRSSRRRGRRAQGTMNQ